MSQAAEQILKHKDGVDNDRENIADDAETRRLQQDAVRRLAQVIDAIKTEMELARQSQGGAGEGGAGGAGGGSQGAGDGISPLAQFKILHALQEDINQRTETFARKHPDADQLTPAEKRELQTIREDQNEVAQLLDELVHPSGEGADR